MIITRSFINRENGRDFYPQPESRYKKGVQRLVMKAIPAIPDVLTWFVEHVRTKGFEALADKLQNFEVSTAPLPFYYDPSNYKFGEGGIAPAASASVSLDSHLFNQDCDSIHAFFNEIDEDSDYDTDSKELLKAEYDPTYTPKLKQHNAASASVDDDETSDEKKGSFFH